MQTNMTLFVGELKVIETESFLQVHSTLNTGALPLTLMLSIELSAVLN